MDVATSGGGKRRVALPILVAQLVVALSGCSGADAGATPSSGTLLRLGDVASLTAQVACDDSETLEGDPAFYDPMKGINCYYDNGEAFLLRAYATDSSVAYALSGLEGTFDESNQFVRGENWYATGSPGRLRALTKLIGSEQQPQTKVTDQPPVLDALDERTSTCMSFLSWLVQSALARERQPDEQIAAIESVYPNAPDLVESVVRQLADSREPTDVAVASQSSQLRDYCRSTEENRDE